MSRTGIRAAHRHRVNTEAREDDTALRWLRLDRIRQGGFVSRPPHRRKERKIPTFNNAEESSTRFFDMGTTLSSVRGREKGDSFVRLCANDGRSYDLSRPSRTRLHDFCGCVLSYHLNFGFHIWTVLVITRIFITRIYL